MTAAPPRLSCRRLAVSVAARNLLSGLDFDVRAGECWVVIGPNGAGKTTLVTALAGLRAPVAGEIAYDGKPLDQLGPRERARIRGFLPQDSVDHFPATVLETALARTRGAPPVVLLHYSPTISTVVGEPEAIYPFLGCSRLAEPLERRPVAAVFHGHAHRGAATGSLAGGTPVFNVSLPLLLRVRPEQPFHLLDYHVPEVRVPEPGRPV